MEQGLGNEVDGNIISSTMLSSKSPNFLDKTQMDEVTSGEIEELRKKLNEGYFENYFSWSFWETLHSNMGSVLGYTFGFLVILLLNYTWTLEEFADATEGHFVAKTFVILFVFFSYSFITLGLELLQFVFLMMEIYAPRYCKQLRGGFANFVASVKLQKLQSSKYFYTPFVVIWCILSAYAGSVLWNWFWWNHICKSYHDRTCRRSWLGQLVIQHRDEACFDGTTTSMLCERFISYAPIMLFSVLFVFLGNVFFPLLNNRLSTYCPFVANLEAAFDMMDHLNQTHSCGSEDEEEKDHCSITSDNGDKSLPSQLKNDKDVVKICLDSKNSGRGNMIRKLLPMGLGIVLLLLLDLLIVKKFVL